MKLEKMKLSMQQRLGDRREAVQRARQQVGQAADACTRVWPTVLSAW